MFRNEADFKKIVSRFNIDNKPNPAHRENLRRQMLSAFNETNEQPSLRATLFQTLRRTIMKRPIPKLAAAVAIIIAILIGINQFDSSIDVTTPTFTVSDVMNAMNEVQWMHATQQLVDVDSNNLPPDKVKYWDAREYW